MKNDFYFLCFSSNTKCQFSIEALGESLNNWGGKDGSIVIVSHDRAFCESIGFTHVGTVMNGSLVLEERLLDERDWAQYDIAPIGESQEIEETGVKLSTAEKEELDRKRKLAFNAPKRIQKIEKMIEDAEQKIAEFDDEMMKCGTNIDTLLELTDKKAKEEDTVANLMEEWEELEDIVAEVG